MQDNYDGKVFRPTSAPAHRILSQMDNEEPLFRRTNQKNIDDIKLAQLNCHQVIMRGLSLRMSALRGIKKCPSKQYCKRGERGKICGHT